MINHENGQGDVQNVHRIQRRLNVIESQPGSASKSELLQIKERLEWLKRYWENQSRPTIGFEISDAVFGEAAKRVREVNSALTKCEEQIKKSS